jgi:hypothetical protein
MPRLPAGHDTRDRNRTILSLGVVHRWHESTAALFGVLDIHPQSE